MDNILILEKLCKTFQDHSETITVLNNVSVSFQTGSSYAIFGNSGTGKSTLLHLIATLEPPTSGKIWLDNQDIFSFSSKQKSILRQNTIGFIFQDHHLLQDFTALENVIIPMLITETPIQKARDKALKLLEQVGLLTKANRNVSQLSGGERQRVAIARSLANNPKLILADEPTGNLDVNTATQVFDLLLAICKQQNCTLLLVTHNQELAGKLDKQYLLSNSQLCQV